MNNKKDIVLIYGTSSIFKMPADGVVISSNIRGACAKENSLASQAFMLAGQKFKEDFEQDMRFPPKYGEVRLFDSYNLGNLFRKIIVAFPGTGSSDDTLTVFKTILDTMALQKLNSISIPLIGTNSGGISIKEWAKQFNIALNQYYERKQSFFPIERINIIISYYRLDVSVVEDIKDKMDSDFIEEEAFIKFLRKRHIQR